MAAFAVCAVFKQMWAFPVHLPPPPPPLRRTAPGSYTGGQGGLGGDALLTISSSEEELSFSACSTVQNRFWMMMGTSG